MSSRIVQQIVSSAQRRLDSIGPRELRGIAKWAAFCISSGWLFGEYVFSWGTVGGPSMYPTYPTNKGTAFADRRARLGHDLAIGDTVQFKHPNLPHSYGIKRVVGMPGDYVCRDAAFGVVVGEEGEMLRVPEGHMWVVGDNLGLSRDSRWFGAVPLGLVVGRSVAFYNEKTGFRRVRRGLQRVTEDP